jgi:signal transduction histidine kinase
VIGQPMTMLCPPDRTGEITDILTKVTNGERIVHYETVRQRKDGTAFPVSVSVSPVNDDYGTMIGAASIARDITAQSQARAASALAARNEEIELANRNLTSFTDSVSHDLRSPLRALSGYSELLLEQYADVLGEEGRGLRRPDRHRQQANIHAHRGPGDARPGHARHHAPAGRRPQRRDRRHRAAAPA